MPFKPIKIWAGRNSVPMKDDLPGWTEDPTEFKIFHNSPHKFEPGDIVEPTTSVYQASINQGMEKRDVKHRDKTPMAWAAHDPDYMKTYHRYTYEVEPITKHSWVEKDPVGFENDEYAASEGYRVKQVVWDKEKDSCSTCEGNGVNLKASQDRYPYHPECESCHGSGLSVSKIAGLQKAGYKLEEIRSFKAPRGY
jgi:hypothetical protein